MAKGATDRGSFLARETRSGSSAIAIHLARNYVALTDEVRGVPPSQHQIKLPFDAARRLLRETKKSVITIANDVGYSNPSHFAQLFRRET